MYKNKQEEIEKHRLYYLNNKEVMKAKARSRYYQIKNSPEQFQTLLERTYFNSIKRKYGLSRLDYQGLLEIQGNKCAICDKEFVKDDSKNSPVVDHNHETGQVRGLLCMQCNLDLEVLENKEFISKASVYLERTNG